MKFVLNASEFQTIRAKCLADFENLLRNLSIAVPDWKNEDEYEIYERLDDEITKKLCRLMKSSSIIDGYIDLLKLGNIKYDFSETDNELLSKIISNRDKIIQGAEQLSKMPVIETPTPSLSISSPQSSTKTVVKEEVETLTGPIILGVILIVIAIICIALLDSSIIGGILVIFGVISAGIGIKGKKSRVTMTVPNNSTNNQPKIQKTVQSSKNLSSQQSGITFNRREVTEIMDVLSQINKIFRSI